MKPQRPDNLRIADEAASWVLRQDRGLSPAEQDEFLQWLAADPHRNAELARQRENWSRLDLLGQWRPEYCPQPNRDLLAPRRLVRSPALPWTIAAIGALVAAAAVALVVRPGSPPALPAAVIAAVDTVAAIESRSLPDGSVAELNRGAAAAVLFTPAERRVLLERGEAHFTVAKDTTRPFIVSAGNVEVRAVGTAFNVRLGQQAVEVLVTEGSVRVDQAGGAAAATVVSQLERGQRSVVPLGGPAPVEVSIVSPDEVDRLLAWQPRLLDFTVAPLRAVVAEFNRRNAPVRLVLVDADLADVEVSASLRSDNVEGFIRLLEVGFAVKVERTGGEIHLRR
jgi:transmembrane sensor